MKLLSFQPPLFHTDWLPPQPAPQVYVHHTVTDTQGAEYGSVAQVSCSQTSGHPCCLRSQYLARGGGSAPSFQICAAKRG